MLFVCWILLHSKKSILKLVFRSFLTVVVFVVLFDLANVFVLFPFFVVFSVCSRSYWIRLLNCCVAVRWFVLSFIVYFIMYDYSINQVLCSSFVFNVCSFFVSIAHILHWIPFTSHIWVNSIARWMASAHQKIIIGFTFHSTVLIAHTKWLMHFYRFVFV